MHRDGEQKKNDSTTLALRGSSVTPAQEATTTPTVYTVGHSTRSIDAFLALLAREGIRHLADIRTFPSSRRHPHFNRDALASALDASGVHYSHHPALGGRRTPRGDDENAGWRNAGFRGYADHMQTTEFASGVDALVAIAGGERTVTMCAEAVPWRCHRSLLADYLSMRGSTVLHIMDAKAEAHRLTSFAILRDGALTYPAGVTAQEDLFDSR
ncbi:MAG: DUF488 domain-containing protein [Gemmatimonadaceae bacterium]